MSKTSKIVSTALATLNDGTALAKKAWKNSDLTSKASALVGAGAGLAAAKKGGAAAIKAVRKHPVGTAVTAAALAAVGAAVYVVNKRKTAAAKPAAKKSTAKQVAGSVLRQEELNLTPFCRSGCCFYGALDASDAIHASMRCSSTDSGSAPSDSSASWKARSAKRLPSLSCARERSSLILSWPIL